MAIVCCTTAFFLLPSSGSISLFSSFLNHMDNHSNHNDCGNHADQRKPCVYNTLERGIPFYIFRKHDLYLRFFLLCNNALARQICRKEITPINNKEKNNRQSNIC